MDNGLVYVSAWLANQLTSECQSSALKSGGRLGFSCSKNLVI